MFQNIGMRPILASTTSSGISTRPDLDPSFFQSEHLIEDDWRWLNSGEQHRIHWNDLDDSSQVRFRDHIRSMPTNHAASFFQHWHVQKTTQLRSFIWPHDRDVVIQCHGHFRKTELVLMFPGAYDLKGAVYHDWSAALSRSTVSIEDEDSDEEDQDNSRNFRASHSTYPPEASSTFASMSHKTSQLTPNACRTYHTRKVRQSSSSPRLQRSSPHIAFTIGITRTIFSRVLCCT